MVPDRAHGDHVVAAHEPRAAGDLGRPRQLPRGAARPAAADRGQEHARLRAARADLRLSDPADRRRADERGPTLPRCLQRARVPAGRDPAGRRRPALEDVLRREPDGRLQHDPRLGRTSARTRGSSRRAPHAVARARVDLGERRRHGHHLSRRTDRRDPRALRGGLGRRRVAVEQDLARHAAAAARRPARDADPADHRDGAGLPRAVPVHLGRPGELDPHGAAADLQLCVRELPRRRLRERDGAEPDARGVPRRLLARLPARDALVEHA